jgi:hypothetical protein
MKYAEQLQAATDELVKLKQWRKVLINLQAELNKMRDLLPIRRDRFQHMEFDNLTRALKNIDQGLTVDTFSGTPIIPYDFMKVMVKRCGLIECDVRIAQLEADLKEWRAYERRWDSPDRRHQYRYTGKPYRHTHDDGKVLEKGDVVLLSESQAQALADRFEAVE